MKCLDTTFLIDFLRGDSSIEHADSLQTDFCTTAMNVFEVLVGVHKVKDELKRMKEQKAAEALFCDLVVLPFDQRGAEKSAEFCGTLIRNGEQIQYQDCVTAGVALLHGVDTIITKDKNHFKRISKIKVEDY